MRVYRRNSKKLIKRIEKAQHQLRYLYSAIFSKVIFYFFQRLDLYTISRNGGPFWIAIRERIFLLANKKKKKKKPVFHIFRNVFKGMVLPFKKFVG